MKKALFTMLFMAIAIGAFAQMQIWSNGTIIFSHDVNDLDSISFSGTPMRVQTVTQEPVTSLAGSIYTSSLSSAGTENTTCGLFFLDDTTGYFVNNNGDLTYPGNQYVQSGTCSHFTYTISGNDIQLTATSPQVSNAVIQGKLIGKDGIVFFNWTSYNSYYQAAAFISINH